MTYLFSFTIAGIAARLKTSVTGLLQGSLQGFRALARLGDVSYPEDPPLPLRPLRCNPSSTLRCVLAGSLLLCLCLLSVFGLPMETAAHDIHFLDGYSPSGGQTVAQLRAALLARGYLSDVNGNYVRPYSPAPDPLPSDIIQWIRVYKNPKIVPLTGSEINRVGTSFGNPVWGFAAYDISLTTQLLPSYEAWEVNLTDPNLFWVQFKPTDDPDDPGGLIDTGENSGLVTATENTSVKVNDLIAIAVRTKGLGHQATPDMAIGPLGTRVYDTLNAANEQHVITREERQWRLNPNMPMSLVSNDNSFNLWLVTELPSGYEHTFVYQFRVEAAHVALNAEAPWLKQDFTTTATPVEQQVFSQALGTYALTIPQGIDWLYGEAEGVLPSSTAVKPWNTFHVRDAYAQNWEVKGALWGRQPTAIFVTDGWANHRSGNNNDATVAHRHVPMYDPAVKERIYYPKLEFDATPATTEIDVPGGTQTGSFTVTLRFFETPAGGSIFEGHDTSDGAVEAFQERLTTALAAAEPPWTVTEMTYAGGIKIASLEGHGTATRYTVTLSPPLGVKGEFALQIPADVVFDTAAEPSGNLASETVMVSVDTSLRLAAGAAVEIVEPESGTYLGGDALEVRVPFAADGLTYEGDAPPYITIYLGEKTSANARHATWQRGEETSGSTIVPFVYVVNAADPVVSSVLVGSEGLSVPEGTTLMSGSGASRVGTAAPPKDSGEEAPADSGSEQVVLATASGAPLPETEAPVNVLPVVLLPSEESDPKSAASSVPRTPIVFNELGNGSGADNDWLELRNVTDASVSLKDWELSVVADAKQEDTSLVVFPDVSVPANGLLLLTNMPSDKTPLAGGDDVAAAGSDKRRKGLQHLSLVDANLSLPDDGKFLLILRNAKEKRGLNEAFVDVAGGGGSGTDAFIRDQTGLYDTHVWPLQVLESPGSDTEDSLSAGKVWLRAKPDIVGYHRDAWAEAAFSGLGYDRKVSKSAETAGTPGYPNGAVKTEPATPKGAVTMSEVMFDSAGGTLPQWIELYNTSKTEALNLNRWELEIQNRKSEDLVGRPVVTLTLQEKMIQPNQTLLIVTGNARASSADVFPADRVYNLIELHEKNLRIKTPRDTFLSTEGFYLKLTDTNGHLVDEIGNTDGDRRTDDTPAWALPVPLSELEGMRSSLVRRYDNGVAREGTSRAGWALAANFAKFKADGLHYGHADDIGTPGYRQGGALPVELSSFTLTRTESGAVVITWTTESEVDNAGFNLRRSLTRDSGYTLLNPALIAGAGTTGERQTYTFIDTSAKPGVEHYYQIEEVSFGGKRETLLMRRLRGPVSPAHRALKTLGEVKQAK